MAFNQVNMDESDPNYFPEPPSFDKNQPVPKSGRMEPSFWSMNIFVIYFLYDIIFDGYIYMC